MTSTGFYQILGQVTNVLDLTFPHPIPALVGYVKLLFLDVRSLVKLDCMNVGGFYGKTATNVIVVPLAVVALCFVIFEAQRRTLAAVIAAGAADRSAYEPLKVKLKQNLFLGIFLVYPVSLHDMYGLSPAAKHPALRLEVTHVSCVRADCHYNSVSCLSVPAFWRGVIPRGRLQHRVRKDCDIETCCATAVLQLA